MRENVTGDCPHLTKNGIPVQNTISVNYDHIKYCEGTLESMYQRGTKTRCEYQEDCLSRTECPVYKKSEPLIRR